MAEVIIRKNALPIDFNLLSQSINDDSRVVMVGDNTHGTKEFYEFRADISKTLITQRGFTLIGVEWDWMDISRINQYILGKVDGKAWDIIKDIQRFPEFMYENHPFESFVEWLKEYNQTTINKVQLFGLDIFGMVNNLRSLAEVTDVSSLLQRLAPYSEKEYDYGYDVLNGNISSLEADLQTLPLTGEFFLDQTIKSVREAEEYYRVKAGNETLGWNLRDMHMARTVIDLINYYSTKMVCWLHNTHSGNAKYVSEFSHVNKTSAAALLRNVLGERLYTIGLLTYSGTVTASNEWYGPTLKFNLNLALPGSLSDLLHKSVGSDFMLIFRNADPELLQIMSQLKLERFIGAAYNPKDEINDHYVHVNIYPQFDTIVFFDQSNAF